MSSLKEKIMADLKEAMKAKDAFLVSVLRMVLSQIHNAEIEKRGELEEEEILKVIQKEIKKRKEAFEIYKNNKVEDLALKEKKEAEILEKYLPEMLSRQEVEKLVEKIILEEKAESPKDIGRVIGRVLKEAQGRAEGSLVAEIVKEKLS